jgi:hypothetical protein
MTKHANTPTQAERIAALQARRAASTTSGRTAGKRRHAAEGSRVLVAGLSVASFLAIGTAVAVAQQQHASTVAAGKTTTILQQTSIPGGAQPVARTVTQTVPQPVTVTQGS